MTYIVTVYQSGNSKVITIPASLDVKIGEKFTLKKNKNQIIMNQIKDDQKQAALKKLHQIAGSLSGWNPKWNDIQKLEEEIEGMYDD